MKIEIVFENRDLLIINKPPGVVVNKAATVRQKTIQDWAEKYLKVSKVERVPKVSKASDTFDTSNSLDTFLARAGIVHRLDKETSGLLVIAKTPEAFGNLQAQFKARKAQKKYLALVHGWIEPKEGRIELPIQRSPFDREKFGVFPGGRRAETRYKAISNFQLLASRDSFGIPISNFQPPTSNFTLLELIPLTGRTHQIRVHLKYIGYPIVADAKYAGRKTSRADRSWCPRMFLHASSLGFFHPRTYEWIEVKLRLPNDLKLVLGKLKKQPNSL